MGRYVDCQIQGGEVVLKSSFKPNNMKNILKLTIVSLMLCMMSVAAFAGTTPQTMHISCTAPNPDHQTDLHRPKGDGNIWTFQIQLEGGAHFVSGPFWDYPGKGGNDPDWGLWTGSGDGESSLGWSSPEKADSFSVNVHGQISCGNGSGGQPIDFAAGWEGDVTDYHLAITSDKAAICAGGVDSAVHQAMITATLTNDDNKPVSGKSINFTLDDTNGQYPEYPFSLNQATATTDEQGEAVITLTSSRVIGNTVKVKATYDNLNKETGEVTSGKPEGAFTTEPDLWWADGVSIYDMIFGLSFNGDPVDGHQLEWAYPQFINIVNEVFTPPNSYQGQITQNDNMTSQSGKANAKFRASYIGGTATFTIIDQTALSEQTN